MNLDPHLILLNIKNTNPCFEEYAGKTENIAKTVWFYGLLQVANEREKHYSIPRLLALKTREC